MCHCCCLFPSHLLASFFQKMFWEKHAHTTLNASYCWQWANFFAIKNEMNICINMSCCWCYTYDRKGNFFSQLFLALFPYEMVASAAHRAARFLIEIVSLLSTTLCFIYFNYFFRFTAAATDASCYCCRNNFVN